MGFFRKEKGYTPWAPRKAPMFNTALNATYIKLPGALLLSSALFVAGVFTSPMIMRHLQLDFSEYSSAKSPMPAVVKAKPIVIAKAPPVTAPAPAPAVLPAASELIVPAIPMVTKISAEQIIQRDYGVSTYDALQFISSAKEASAKTGIDPALLLAVAAKTTNFQMFNGKKFVGVMNIKPELHQKEVQKLKLENVSYATVNGSFRLGAEVLLSHFNQSNGDMNLAVTNFLNTYKLSEQANLTEVLELKKAFEGI